MFRDHNRFTDLVLGVTQTHPHQHSFKIMTNSEQILYISCVEEVRYSFISHLSEALRRKGIHDVFVDSDDLLSDESQSKVERAMVSVMVLPVNHKVNLDKLVKVLECQKNKDQVVVPVLYGVRSLEIEWLIALDSKGFSSVHYSRKECSDSQLVKEIVRDVYEKLFHTGRNGIYSKLLEIEKMVSKQPLNIRCVGIWGMPGIGKTTLAKAVFDQMSGEFDAYCFIEDYTKAIQEKGLYRLLEEQFLKEKAVAGGTNTKLTLLRDKLNNKRVLVVLDDVLNPLAVESFLGGFDWFGPKSLIIITSRDKQVFRLCQVNQIYEVQGLDEKEALQLFSLCASLDDMAEQNLHEVSMKVIKYANGHPLALNLYGRELKGKKRPPEMETAFLELKERPPPQFVDAIKGSYETLNDGCRNIFLDIACFFKGENVDYVMQLLEGCGFFPHVGIDILVEKCLVTVSENRVCMHNLIQDVGRQIGRRSRLWDPWSIKYLLEDNEHNADAVQGTEEIEGMFLDTLNLSFDIKPAAFDNMLRLRLLKIYCSNPEIHPVISFPDGYIRSLPNELRLLHWENYPLQFLPVNFDPMHLVEINMPYSQLCRLWDGTKNLEMLRTIRLCHSQQLVDIDDLLKAPNLEVIDLQGCTRLQSFPATGQLLHLRVVNLSGCTEIKSFPEIPPNIETLHLQGTGIIELPLSIVKPNYRELLNLLAEIPGLSGVSNLEQSDLKPLTSLMKMGTSNINLGKLISLDLKDCPRLRSLPDMDNLELLKVLDLSGCSELETIQGFPRNLKKLYLAGTAVRQVPQLPQNLELFNAHGCVSLKSIRLNFEKLPVHYTFSNCFDLSPQVVSDFLVKALANAQHITREHQELNEAPAFSLCVPSHANQNSILDLQLGSSVMTQLNPSWRNTLVGFAMLVEVAFSEDYCDATGFGIRCVCKWKNEEGHSHRIEKNLHCWAPGKAVPKVQKDHTFVFCDVNMHPSNDKGNDPDICADLVVFEFFPVDKQTKPLNGSCTVRRCGVRVITDANCNTSIENISRVLSLDPVEVSGNEGGEVLRISYDGLQEIDKALFLYIAGLFNDEDVGLVAPLIANIIDIDVSYRLKILADRSLIRVSSNGEIMMPCLLRQMGKEILYTDSKEIERLGDNSMINTEKNERMRKVKKVACVEVVGSQSGEEGGVWQIKGSPYPRCNSSKDCSARKQVERSSTDPEEAKENLIFQSDREEVDRYVKAVDEVQRHISSISISDEVKSASSTIQIAMARLEDELRNILISQTSTFEPDSLLLDSSLSSSSFASSSSRTELEDDNIVIACDGKEEEQQQLDLVLPDGLSTNSGSSRLSRSRRSNSKSTSSIREIDLISTEAVSELRSIAERMIGAGYSRECVQVYRTVRKSAMETTFKQLGVVKLGIGDVQRLNWEAVEVNIKRWIPAAKVCVRVVFVSEKRLCEQIFEDTMEETCFMEIVKASALQLFSFPEAISISRRSPEKLFNILDLHDCLTDLLPDMKEIFDSKSSEAILVQASEIQSRLAEAVRGILTEFENAVFRDSSIVPFPGGTIHPLTRYVMNYIVLICDYKQTLIDLIMTKPCRGLKCTNDPNNPDMDISELEGISPLIWAVVMLQFNLEKKSLHYKDEPLSHIFVMNNVHYIVQKVKRSPELMELIGDKYLRKLTGIIRHAATKYQRATWVGVLNSLRDEGLHVSGRFSSGVSKSALREKFKAFNTMFEEVHRIQSTWSVPDTQLREELRMSLAEHLIPAYRSFLGRFRGHIESGRHPENYLKYSVENLETAVLDFLEGYTTAPHLRRSQ